MLNSYEFARAASCQGSLDPCKINEDMRKGFLFLNTVRKPQAGVASMKYMYVGAIKRVIGRLHGSLRCLAWRPRVDIIYHQPSSLHSLLSNYCQLVHVTAVSCDSKIMYGHVAHVMIVTLHVTITFHRCALLIKQMFYCREVSEIWSCRLRSVIIRIFIQDRAWIGCYRRVTDATNADSKNKYTSET